MGWSGGGTRLQMLAAACTVVPPGLLVVRCRGLAARRTTAIQASGQTSFFGQSLRPCLVNGPCASNLAACMPCPLCSTPSASCQQPWPGVSSCPGADFSHVISKTSGAIG
ncbi:hypothetical protein F4801DRAFT_150043 [Xylaria longipes]|nr:hypothetical protein F4801DRAFT_150043 [Xylaria longipes]